MVNFIICDDNSKIVKNMENIIDNYMMKNNIEYKTHVFSDYDRKFMEIMKKNMPFKIYILDIETPTRSGIDIARMIRNKDINSVIIFITSHEELGLTVLKNEIMFLSFINKFDDYEKRLISSITKSLKILKTKRTLRFEEKGVIYTISIDDILYITRDSIERKSIIKTDYNEFKTTKTLNELKELLNDNFIQTHRACFVNKDRVAKIDKIRRKIYFDNGEKIDLLSLKYKKEISLI